MNRVASTLLFALTLVACDAKLDQRGFQRKAESAYMEVSSGWTIAKREEDRTYFVRGDQLDVLEVADMFRAYQKSGVSSGDWFDTWVAAQKKLSEARKRTLAQAESLVIPILKSGNWIRVQDLGAIGPPRVRDQIRPFSKEVASEVYAVLGIPEEKLGYRFASIEEVATSEKPAEAWMELATANILRIAGTSTRSVSHHAGDGRLLFVDLENIDGVSGLIFSPRFRADMLARFGLPALGACAANRDVLIVFDSTDFVTVKPIRARCHQLYDNRNHPGFRDLLRFDKETVSLLEPAAAKKKE